MFYSCSKLLRPLCGPSRPALTLDDLFFRLYHRVTSSILLLSSLIILVREWSVDSIDCNIPSSIITALTGPGNSGAEVSYYRINAYCKLHNTFLPVSSSVPCLPNNSLAVQGVPNSGQFGELPKYQWFSLLLFTASIALLIPHLLWSCCNRSMVKSVANGRFRRSRSTLGRFSLPDTTIRTLQSSSSTCHQVLFTTLYLLLKLFNLILLLGLVTLTNQLLHHQFLSYPLQFFTKIQQQHEMTSLIDQALPNCNEPYSARMNNPFLELFPKSSLCPYTYLPTTTSSPDSVASPKTILVHCLMPINSLLEQLFLFHWFWYAVLLLFTCLDFTRYFFFFLVPPLRIAHLKYATNSLLQEATYKQCSHSFGSWLFTSIVLLNNLPSFSSPTSTRKYQHKRLEVINEESEDMNENNADDDATHLYENIQLQSMTRPDRLTNRQNGEHQRMRTNV